MSQKCGLGEHNENKLLTVKRFVLLSNISRWPGSNVYAQAGQKAERKKVILRLILSERREHNELDKT